MPQTTVQREDAIRFGSGKIELGNDLGSLVDVGALRDLRIIDKSENIEIEMDNVEDLKYFIDGKRLSFAFMLVETFADIEALVEKGRISVTNVAGTPVAGASQAVTGASYDFNDFIEIENQNGDGSAITVNSVTGSTDGALVADTDYVLVKNGQGRYGIAIIDSATVTTMNQTFTINYDYTPNAAKEKVYVEFGQKEKIVARLTHTNTDGNTIVVELDDVTNINALTYPFTADDSNEVQTVELELEGNVTKWRDEQAVV